MSATLSPPAATATTGVEIKLSSNILSHQLFAFTPEIDIDGIVHRRRWWSSNPFHLPPGQHFIRISFPYFFSPKCGLASIRVKVTEGKTVQLSYYMGWLMFLPGILKVVD